jgi:hypothetical protein
MCHNLAVTDDDIQQQDLQVQIAWPEGLADQAQVANQFMLAFDGSSAGGQQAAGVYLLVGHVGAPVWATSQEAAEQHIANFGSSIPVQPRGAFFMSHGKAYELWQALGKHLGVS